ncbi:Flp family type IVb pilin [Anaeromicrobium sediminis]|uniref:Flp family type IVb pilin n=2 Tax=Anaeromicrobium sediminis TaxID=1478221 RepID=A0A267MFP9_9FIRM|nr:Flp family type IVb pilin [Anaeromicrobium sediminis]PAB58376.1 Flp family type IVb pilin [Anaeromicrobium sediminis]
MLKKLKGLITEEKGQGMTEYGLILGVIAVAVLAVIGLFGTSIENMFKDTLEKVEKPTSTES